MVLKITSLQNPLVKKILLLKEKSKIRKKEGLFIIEGLRELTLALESDFTIETLLYYPELIVLSKLQDLVQANTKIIEISKPVFEKLAYRSTTEGIIAIAKVKKHNLDSIVFKTSTPLILVAEAPEKPGNIGALLRTADAAGIDAFFIANPKTDLYNPNIIRSSVGCVFTNQIATGSTEDILAFLKKQKIKLYSAALHKDSVSYTLKDYTNASALIVGTEATGLSDLWLENSEKIIIPMRGKIDSLNVSVSAAVLIFEAVRQRE